MVEITLPVCIDQGDVDVTISISDRDYQSLKRAYLTAEEDGEQLQDIMDLDDELAERITKKVFKVLNTEPDYTDGLDGFEPGDCLEDMFDIAIGLPEALDK